MIRPGIKARVVEPPGHRPAESIILGAENIGVVVIVGNLASPNEYTGMAPPGPQWHVTSITRAFVKYGIKKIYGTTVSIRKEGSFWNVVIPECMLQPIEEDPLPVEEDEKDLELTH